MIWSILGMNRFNIKTNLWPQTSYNDEKPYPTTFISYGYFKTFSTLVWDWRHRIIQRYCKTTWMPKTFSPDRSHFTYGLNKYLLLFFFSELPSLPLSLSHQPSMFSQSLYIPLMRPVLINCIECTRDFALSAHWHWVRRV